jgi:hypothetical protein
MTSSHASTSRAGVRALHAGFWSIGTFLAAIEAWKHRYDVGSDGLAYLDVGGAYLRGDWLSALSGYWSPLYAVLTGAAIGVVRPGPEWEAPLVHGVNVVCFVFAMGAFAFFLTELVAQRTIGLGERATLGERALLAVGYVVFLWSLLTLVDVQRITPDLLGAGFFFLACGLMVRRESVGAGTGLSIALGATLGLGYLTKAAALPVGLLFLGVCFVRDRRNPRPWRNVAITAAAFALVSLPFAAALSVAKGRPTYGAAGALNYAWFASVVPYPPIDWRGQPEGTGSPVHPRRQVHAAPAVYEFGTPIVGTYAYWQDPSYWYEGVRAPFSWRQQLKALKINGKELAHELLSVPSTQTVVIERTIPLGLLILAALGGWRSAVTRDWPRYAFLLVPALAAIALYLPIHVEPRYIGAACAVLYTTLFAALTVSPSAEARRVAACVSALVVLTWFAPVAYRVAKTGRSVAMTAGTSDTEPARSAARWDKADTAGRRWQLAVAADLRRLGLREGDRIGFIGYLSRFYWARLAGLRIVAEIRQPLADELYWFAPEAQRYSPDVDAFWSAGPAIQSRVMDAFVRTGARAVVADRAPAGAEQSGWRALGNTGFHAYLLESRDGARP